MPLQNPKTGELAEGLRRAGHWELWSAGGGHGRLSWFTLLKRSSSIQKYKTSTFPNPRCRYAVRGTRRQTRLTQAAFGGAAPAARAVGAEPDSRATSCLEGHRSVYRVAAALPRSHPLLALLRCLTDPKRNTCSKPQTHRELRELRFHWETQGAEDRAGSVPGRPEARGADWLRARGNTAHGPRSPSAASSSPQLCSFHVDTLRTTIEN